MEHGSRTRLVSAGVIAAVFGAGVVIGFAADTNLGSEPAEVVSEVVEESGSDERSRSPLYAQLGPTTDQQALIDSIIVVHRERTNALNKENRRALRRGFRQILLETRQAIKELFTAEQGEEYQRLLDEYDARRAAERENRDDPN